MFSRIIEPNLELRLFELIHAEEAFAAANANRAHLSRFMPWIHKTNSPDDTRAFIRKSLQQFTNNDGFSVGIWENGRIIGSAGFHWIRWETRYTEIGYWLAQDMQGRGIMTKVCGTLIDHAFDIWKLNKVEIRCDPENLRSRAIPKRLGFTAEATLRQVILGGDGELHDAVVYGILASEWKGMPVKGSLQ